MEYSLYEDHGKIGFTLEKPTKVYDIGTQFAIEIGFCNIYNMSKYRQVTIRPDGIRILRGRWIRNLNIALVELQNRVNVLHKSY